MHILTQVVYAGEKKNNKARSFREGFMAGGSCNKDSSPKSDAHGPRMQHLNLWLQHNVTEENKDKCNYTRCSANRLHQNWVAPRILVLVVYRKQSNFALM